MAQIFRIIGTYIKHFWRLFEKSWKTYHGLFLEGVYKIELDTKTEYEGF
jgi:hypothetical protein